MSLLKYASSSLVIVCLLVSACAEHKSRNTGSKPAGKVTTAKVGDKAKIPSEGEEILAENTISASQYATLNLSKEGSDLKETIVKISNDLKIKVLISNVLVKADAEGKRGRVSLVRKGLLFVKDELAGERNRESLKSALQQKEIAAVVISEGKTKFTLNGTGKRVWHIDIVNNDRPLNGAALIRRLENLTVNTVTKEAINDAELKRATLSATYQKTFILDTSLNESRIAAATHIVADPSSTEAQDVLEMSSVQVVNELYKTKDRASDKNNSAYPTGLFDNIFKQAKQKIIVLSNKCEKVREDAIKIPANSSLTDIQACLEGKTSQLGSQSGAGSAVDQASEESYVD